MHALIFVVISVIRAALGVFPQEIYHFILVKRNTANVCVEIFVIVVKFTAFAILNTFVIHINNYILVIGF